MNAVHQVVQPSLLPDPPPSGPSGTPPCALCCEPGEQRSINGGYYRYDGRRFGVQGKICRRCYFHFQRLVRERRRQAARDAAAQLQPREEPLGAGDLAERLYAAAGLRCCTVVEFRLWLVAALVVAGIADESADAGVFCRDAQERWCALQQQAGLCSRVPMLLDQPGVWCSTDTGCPGRPVDALRVALGA